MAPLAALLVVMLAWSGVQIVGKAGFNRWLGLLLAVPVANVALLIWLALAQWPAPRNGAPQRPGKLPPPPSYD